MIYGTTDLERFLIANLTAEQLRSLEATPDVQEIVNCCNEYVLQVEEKLRKAKRKAKWRKTAISEARYYLQNLKNKITSVFKKMPEGICDDIEFIMSELSE